MAPIEGVTASSTQQNLPKGDTVQNSQYPLVLDQNDNFLEKGVESSWKLPGETNGKRSLYSSVDRQFLEFMLDAVNRGYVPSKFLEDKALLENGLVENEMDVKPPGTPAKNEVTVQDSGACDDQTLVGAESGPQESQRASPIKSESSFPDSEPAEIQKNGLSYNEGNHEIPSAKLASGGDDLAIKASGVSQNQSEESPDVESLVPSTTEEPAVVAIEMAASDQTTPKCNKRVQFSGLDTVFNGKEDMADKGNGAVIVPVSAEEQRERESRQLLLEGTATWASLSSPDALSDGIMNGSFLQWKPVEEADDLHGDDHVEVDGFHGDDVDDDPFMQYLDSIEHTALKFKLQVERAKVDTLQTLKSKLEEAYEGTPLEEIPSKFQEKLQGAIAQIISEEVHKKYATLVDKEDEMCEEETKTMDCMKNELDSVAADNFCLNQQLEVLKGYEKGYYELKDEVDVLNEEIVQMRSECERKKGESEFLSERVEELEKGMVNMRVEYEDQVREMQKETLELQRMLTELENRSSEEEEETYHQNGSIREDGETYEDEKDENMYERENVEYNALQRELEAMRFRLEVSERHNKALRTATDADQAMIRCLEGKVVDVENALNKSQDENSRLLSDLHEAQRQHSSDRAKLSSYQEETSALERENKLLKSSLEIAENEMRYLQGKGKRNGEPWKNNRKQIWREIRELERILKDVHKEKRSIEKKFVSFKQETDIANNSLTSYSPSPPQSPESLTDTEVGPLRSVSWQNNAIAKEDLAPNDALPGTVATPPQKVNSWIDDIHTPSGLVTSVTHPRQNSGSPDR